MNGAGPTHNWPCVVVWWLGWLRQPNALRSRRECGMVWVPSIHACVLGISEPTRYHLLPPYSRPWRSIDTRSQNPSSEAVTKPRIPRIGQP